MLIGQQTINEDVENSSVIVISEIERQVMTRHSDGEEEPQLFGSLEASKFD